MIGGAERYTLSLGDLLAKHGHDVAYFSTIDRGNINTKWNKYFIKKLDFKTKTFKNSLDKFPKIFYSFEAKKNISKLLDSFKPDIVHLQNIYYYITSSIINEIKKRGIPIVQTVHDYQLINPSVIMFHNGSICEICKKDNYYKAIFHKCVKNSYTATLMSVINLYFQNFNDYHQKNIDVFITPSLFMEKKLIEYGFSKSKIVQINNFLYASKAASNLRTSGKNVLFYGRICEAKGIFLILKAAEKLPGISFKIAGNFEDEEVRSEVYKKIADTKIENVEILGFKRDKELDELIRKSLFVLVPSLWYENQPYSVLEAFNFGKPVVASKIGGLPELLDSDKNGFLFEPNDVKDFIQKIQTLLDKPNLAKKFGLNAKKMVESKYDPELHYKSIMATYNKVII